MCCTNNNEKTIKDLNTIAYATDILIQKFRPYNGTEDNISKKEIIKAINGSLEEMSKLHYIK